MQLTSRFRFSAAHRLDAVELTPVQNRELYGKCNNPHGHGHDYVLDVTVEGPPDVSGLVARRAALDTLVREAVIQKLDHRFLNKDVAEFASAVPTTENLATVIRDYLKAAWTLPAKLVRVTIAETDRNTFVWEAGK
jgi:6-pyruvoyltetrahydropterin/6-carboxytetrahydropterin synthase